MPSRSLSSEIARLLADREALASQRPAAGGWAVVRALSDAVDRAVVGIWQRLGPKGSSDTVALVAVGGYGRRELAPASDIDLMVLHAGVDSHGSKAVAEAAEALFYELWDSGMQVGHSVRTLKEALAIAKADLSAETAFLDARLVDGDQTLFDRFLAATLAQSRRSRPPFLDRIRIATGERYRRADEAYGALEPNLKDGRGGLRDYQTIGWVSKVCGISGSYEPQRLMDAVGRVHLVRTALHDVTGRHTDSLGVQWQPQVAAALDESMDPTAATGSPTGRSGVAGSAGPDAEERLMRMVYESCRTISYSLDTVLDPEAASALADLPQELREGEWTEKGLRAFLDLLASGGVAVPVLRALDETGALVRLLHGWEHVRCLPQRNIYHRWPVDLHSFETVAALAAFAPFAPGQAREPRPEGRTSAGGIFRRALAREAIPPAAPEQAGGAGASHEHRPDWQDLTRRVAADAAGDWDRLLVAALFHDIGKGDGEDHSTRGERLAREAALRMGMPAGDTEEIAWLVRQHLTLTTTAVRRNVDDESLVVELAEMVGSVGRLRLLYLLSVADGLATGPAAWTPWKAALVGDLFTRIFHLLDRGELVSQRASLLARARSADLRAALESFPRLRKGR